MIISSFGRCTDIILKKLLCFGLKSSDFIDHPSFLFYNIGRYLECVLMEVLEQQNSDLYFIHGDCSGLQHMNKRGGGHW